MRSITDLTLRYTVFVRHWFRMLSLQFADLVVDNVIQVICCICQSTPLANSDIKKLNTIQLEEWALNLIKENSMSKNQHYNATIIIREMVGHADERTTYNSYCFDRSNRDERYKKIDAALS